MTPVYIVDIIGEVVTATNNALKADKSSYLYLNNKNINYTYGRTSQIVLYLQRLTDAPSLKSTKYPLIALVLDIPESRGNAGGYYANVLIKKLVIGALSDPNDSPETKMNTVFKPILYPIYYEFLKQLSRHKSIVLEVDIPHTKTDRMGTIPSIDEKTKAELKTKFNDFIDSIEVENLQITVQQYC